MNTNTKSNFHQLADVSLPNGDRVVFYIQFDLKNISYTYAAKKQEDGVRSSEKNPNIGEIIAWLGFNELATELYKSEAFSQKIKLNIVDIIPNLKVVKINDIFSFIYKNNDAKKWFHESDLNQIYLIFGEELKTALLSNLGKSFFEEYTAYNEETSKIKDLNASYREDKLKIIEESKATNN